jgi:1-acyl-sn-glycerol-3-phosphate acyltransferase
MIDLIIRCILYPIKFILFLTAHIILLFPRRIYIAYSKYCLQIILWSIGFTLPTIIDKRTSISDNNNDPPIIVFQHTTFADGYILLYVFGLVRFLINSKHIQNPIVKRFTDNFGCILVNEKIKTGVSEKIQEYVNDGDYSHRLVISPEGGRMLDFDKNEILCPFSSGAFVPLVPIQPVLMKFTCDDDDSNNPTWNMESIQNNDNIIQWYFSRLFVRPCSVTITLMEKVSASEGMTPKEYANDVRNKMIAEITGTSIATTVAVPLKNEIVDETIDEIVDETGEITDIKGSADSDKEPEPVALTQE